MNSNLLRMSAALALSGLVGCSSGEEVSSEAYGDDWPFPFKGAVVTCEPPGSAVILKVNGNKYALNGRALTQASSRGYIDHRSLMPRDTNGVILKGSRTISDLIRVGLKYCS